MTEKQAVKTVTKSGTKKCSDCEWVWLAKEICTEIKFQESNKWKENVTRADKSKRRKNLNEKAGKLLEYLKGE